MDHSSSPPKPKPITTTKTAVATTSPPLLRRLISVDSKLSLHLHTLAKPLLSPSLLLLLELSADFRLFFPLSLSLLLAPATAADRLRPFLVPFLLGLLLDLALVGLLKILVRRSRPHYNPNNMSVAVSVDHFSFPSGHSSRVFFVAASFFYSSDLDFFSLATAVWAWAAATALSRVLLGRHFVVDVLAGACLGVLEALFAFRFLRFEKFLF
ncbi:Presqualene diphosphate phosphatase [Morus notabilis]|uniref:Presqualene diphosphate phosphatase n=1 Tax=Morus notabilis TaxID=981085 RepID=W9R4R1_9ROSA|nr:probable lipid phosphate phosphatase beta [Morus notabilis]XP_024019632.1 probable lipid phosphate phosphatase beta [Morus notabilis]EXB54480.1 Presqualene diphosphate phosphatase [Morus notabilis]